MNNIFLRLTGFALIVLFLVACRKDQPSPITTQFNNSSSGVFISNEGNFQFGNASVGFYNPNDQSYAKDLFKSANNRPLGDVCQSLYFFNNKIYITVNNSNKIEVVNPTTFSSIATITGFQSPRYFLPVSIQKAYVTDYNANAISVIDLNSNSLIKKIPCKGWTEELIASNGKVYVTNKNSHSLYIIDPLNDLIIDSIQIGYGANSIQLDRFNRLWVLANGNAQNNELASFSLINTTNDSVVKTIYFNSTNEQPWRLKINGSADTLYYLNNGVYALPINATQLNNQPLIPENKRLFYGLGIDPFSNIIYVSDAIDYVQSGIIYRFQSNGQLINSFKAGIIPNDFYFKP
jgi:YVTN family beta-propeller protein